MFYSSEQVKELRRFNSRSETCQQWILKGEKKLLFGPWPLYWQLGKVVNSAEWFWCGNANLEIVHLYSIRATSKLPSAGIVTHTSGML